MLHGAKNDITAVYAPRSWCLHFICNVPLNCSRLAVAQKRPVAVAHDHRAVLVRAATRHQGSLHRVMTLNLMHMRLIV